MIDVTEFKKPLKKINDHHKNSSVVSLKFCDWIKERNIKEVMQVNSKTINKKEDKQLWMFVSSDTEGRVIVTTVSSLALGVKRSIKIVCVNPNKFLDFRPFPVLACKFHNSKYKMPSVELDSASLIAMGSNLEVCIHHVVKETCPKILTISRPKQYPSQNTGMVEQFQKQHQIPCLAWGYGRTPCFKDQSHCLLAIAWGPLIQLVIAKDVESKTKEDFYMDGHYFIAPNTIPSKESDKDYKDVWVESMHFLDESLLICVTNTRTVRVLYTQ